MTAKNITNQPFKMHAGQSMAPMAPQDGPFQYLPADLVRQILYLSNNDGSAGLVSKNWNNLTFAVVKERNQELKNAIPRIIEKLSPDTQAECIAELAQLQEAYPVNAHFVVSFPEARKVFLAGKGALVGIIRKRSEEERDQLQVTISKELPDSLKDVFEISKLNLNTFENVDLDTFLTLLQSFPPLSMNDRGPVVYRAVCLNNIEFVMLLLANGPIAPSYRRWAVYDAARNNNLELVKLLMNHGPMFKNHQGLAVYDAARSGNLELVKLLLAYGSISEYHRVWAIAQAAWNQNFEIVSELMNNQTIGMLGDFIAITAWFASMLYSKLPSLNSDPH